MRKIIFLALLAMTVPVSAFAADNDRGERMEAGKKEMRAMQDKHMQERRAMEDECHGKMKAMQERHQKERDEFKAKHGMGKGGKEGMGGMGGSGGGKGSGGGGGYE